MVLLFFIKHQLSRRALEAILKGNPNMAKSGKIMRLFLATMVLLSACVGPPSSELVAARDAIDEVVSEGAELFTPVEVLALNKKLEAALAEIYDQDSRAIQNYALAKFILQQVITDAELLKEKLTWRKAELNASAEEALSVARASIDEVRNFLASARQGQCSRVDLTRVQYEIDRLEVEITRVQPQIDASEYAAATEMASEITSRAFALYSNAGLPKGGLAALE